MALNKNEIKERPLRLGLSCRAVVDIRQGGSKMVPTTTSGPLYSTAIFQIEEEGDEPFIRSIISDNLDPGLLEYTKAPLAMPAVEISLPPILQEALEQDAFLQNKIVEIWPTE